MCPQQGAGKTREDYSPAELAQITEILEAGGPERTARIIRASLTPEQLPHAEAIIEAYEDALAPCGASPEEQIGTALTNAHRAGQDPAEVAHRWL